MLNRNKAEEETGAIDLTPMLDVVFIMLIFFIVTASFIKEPGVSVDRPDATMADDVKTPILIAITSENKVWVNKSEYEMRQVKTQIELLLAETPRGKIVIQADRGANIKALTEVAQAAREAGAGEVTISTQDK